VDAPYLLALGFVVGLSGAMMPGPLFVYTVAQSLKKGWKTGIFVIIGHAIVETALMVLLLLGLSSAMSAPGLLRAVSAVGGAVMILYGLRMLGARWRLEKAEGRITGSAIVGGMTFTALNPGFPLWWATAGAGLLAEGMRQSGMAGALLVLMGHWIADFGYFTLVAALTERGSVASVERYSKAATKMLASALLLIGGWFIWNSL